MADRRISELTQITGANVDDDNDELVIVDASGGQTRAITRRELFKGIDGEYALLDESDVQSDPEDTTANALMGVGAFGLGTTRLPSLSGDIFQDSATGFYYARPISSSGAADSPSDNNWNILKWQRNSDFQTALAIEQSPGAPEFYVGLTNNGVQGDWEEVYHTGNLAPQSGPTDTTDGRFLTPRAFGLGATSAVTITDDLNNSFPNGLYYAFSSSNRFMGANGHVINMNFDDTNEFKAQIAVKQSSSPSMGFRTKHSNVWGGWIETYHTGNTTVDGSGFLLEASPVLRVHATHLEEPNTPVGATLTHNETGVYVLSDVEPLATEGWQVRTPSDVNGNKVVAITDPEYDAATRTLTLRTHDLLWHEGRLVPGEPMDIPEGHFVMLRFHEPETPDPAT